MSYYYQLNQAKANSDFSGYLLEERYKLQSVIGAGGFGKVYKAADKSLPGSPFVAVKCVARPDPGSRRARLLNRELNLHRKVSSHPNILTFHQHFENDFSIWMVLDFCDGGDLRASMATGRFYNNEELVKKVMVQLIDALQYCHDNNVQHNDLKPANVLLGLDDHVYLADFGIASETPISEVIGCGTQRRWVARPSDVHFPLFIPTSGLWDTDVQFATFIKDPEFLYKTLSISESVQDILRPVLAMNPLARTPLSELRKQILSVDTFWKPDMEPRTILPYSSPPVQPCINLDSTIITDSSDSSVGPITPPTNAFEPEVQASAGQGHGKPCIHLSPRQLDAHIP
ncbi:kinase-like domain-containing protein [Mycena floridula]|nr:kinase-like domain-containing protein [Mycena floridula]